MTELLRYVSIDDCGAVMNQTLLEGQIWGGLLQGLGQVFGELCVYGEDGQIVTGSFMDYPMPHADLVRRVTIETVLVPSPTNGLGVKGVGEAGTVGSSADGDECGDGRAAVARGGASGHAGLGAACVAGAAPCRSGRGRGGGDGGVTFASRTVAEHLARGVGAAGLIAAGVWLVAAPGPLRVGGGGAEAFVTAALLMRGCPTCWLMGLAETIANRGRDERLASPNLPSFTGEGRACTDTAKLRRNRGACGHTSHSPRPSPEEG